LSDFKKGRNTNGVNPIFENNFGGLLVGFGVLRLELQSG
jgi:hypothetical protein